MHLEKFRLDQIQNGPLSAIIYFHMPNIWQTMLDDLTITIKQNVMFRGMTDLDIFFTRFKMSAYRPLSTFTCPIFGTLVLAIRPYHKTKCEVSGDDAP